MKFIVDRTYDREYLEHNFAPADLAKVITLFINQDRGPSSPYNERNVDKNLNGLIAGHQGQDEFQLSLFKDPTVFTFKGTWKGENFTISEVILYEDSYTQEMGRGHNKIKRSDNAAEEAFNAAKAACPVVNNGLGAKLKNVGGSAVTGLKKGVSALGNVGKSAAKGAGKGAAWLTRFIPHLVATAVAYVSRNAIIDGAKALALRAGVTLPAFMVSTLGVVGSALGFTLATDFVRSKFKSSKEASYQVKDDEALGNLEQGHVNAFLNGVEAQKGWVAQAKTCFSYNNYRHGNAFYAGMGAQAHGNDELIEKIKARKVNP